MYKRVANITTKIALLLILLLKITSLHAMNSGEVRAAYTRLGIPLTDNRVTIEKSYHELLESKNGEIVSIVERKKIREARNLILKFLQEYDISILRETNESELSKIPSRGGMMGLLEDNRARVKSAFTAYYQGSYDDFDSGSRARPSRARETIYPAYYEIVRHYEDMISVQLAPIDLIVYEDVLELSIHTKQSYVPILKDFYLNLASDRKELFSILISILADEGTRGDLTDFERTNYFNRRVEDILKFVETSDNFRLERVKSLYRKMSIKLSGVDNFLAPYYLDTILTEFPEAIKRLAPRGVDAHYFLFHGVLAPFVQEGSFSANENLLLKASFALNSKLKKVSNSDEVTFPSFVKNEILVIEAMIKEREAPKSCLDLAKSLLE